MKQSDKLITLEEVTTAIEQGGSIRAAAKILGKSYTALQWWLARNGYEIRYKAEVVRIERNVNA